MRAGINSPKPNIRYRYHLGDITAVVPARNAADLLPECLSSIRAAGITHIVVVDGLSTDDSREIAARYGTTVLSDGGGGLPLARSLGVAAANTPIVALVDADVVFPAKVFAQLLKEFTAGEYVALQAGLLSVSGPGYWGRALVFHHRTGRSRWWFGLVATLFERETLMKVGFDADFPSGEDIELRWRLENLGLRAGVSRTAIVEHRFAGDDFSFARDQFLMDGTGLGLMIRKHGWRGARLALLPLAAAVRGTVLSLVRGEPQWLLYFASFCWFNYVGMKRGLSR